LAHPRFGLVVPRLGETAVARNRLRRRLKELWRRELQGRLAPLDVVVRASRASYRATFAQLRADLVGWADSVAE
jgi:ribonuclease P protein component